FTARAVAIADSLSETEREKFFGRILDAKGDHLERRSDAYLEYVLEAGGPNLTQILLRGGPADSLRHSTAAYVRTLKMMWARIGGLPEDLYPLPHGKRVPDLEGELWLGCANEPCEPRPVPGRISLVVFFT